MTPRRARPADASEVARLLHDFNAEFDTPSPGRAFLESRLRELLGGEDVVALLGEPDTAVAVLTFRPNVWYAGPVALLDELYVRPPLRSRGIGGALLTHACTLAAERRVELLEINVDEPDTDARRFYEAHGFTCTEPGTGQRSLFYWREL
jgi:GNAT superfamily N-acetyltransferase